MEQFITANGCALRIYDSAPDDAKAGIIHPAERPAILLLHGYLESLDVWEEFIPLLRPHARVIGADLPGHGISEVKGDEHSMEFLADTVAQVLRAREVERCVVVGHSLGGYVALALLERHPEVVSGIVLFHSTPDPDPTEKKKNRQREIAILRAGKKDLLVHTVEKAFAPENRRRMNNSVEWLREIAELTEDDGIAALLRGMENRQDRNDVLRRSEVAQLLIFGRWDEYITPETAEKIIGAHPQAEVFWLEKSAHEGFIEEPEVSAVRIVTFLKSLL